jgi:hypothetical protein
VDILAVPCSIEVLHLPVLRMTSSGVVLRNKHLVGGHLARLSMPDAHKAAFQEGCAIIFSKWTALQLGVANEWGGANSKEKAQQLLEDVIQWFYTRKGMFCTGIHHMVSMETFNLHCAHQGAIPTMVPFCADHEMLDLEDLLDEALEIDYRIKAEDDSPYQVRVRGCEWDTQRLGGAKTLHAPSRPISKPLQDNRPCPDVDRPLARQHAQPGGTG